MFPFRKKKHQDNSSNGRATVGYEVSELKRAIGTWGSFCMGYADVGADVYIALGIIAYWANAAAPIAFAIAAITYVTTGLCYTELATAYPVAGGAHFFSLKAFGDFHGFTAGWALMLDYTIDIALFALAAVGYLSFFLPAMRGNPAYGVAAVLLILLLVFLNLIGIRESSAFNEFFVAVDLITLSVILIGGFLFVFNLGTWASQIQWGKEPTSLSFVHGVSLAVASFIGIESISQAAEETKNPEKVIPRASKAAIISVLVVAISLSLLSVGVMNWRVLVEQYAQDPITAVASRLPVIGLGLAVWTAFMGFAICSVSTNTGVIGVSRVAYSMGRLRLTPKVFSRVHRKFRTPFISIAAFSVAAILLILGNILLRAVDLLLIVADLYSFGALLAYMYVNLALIVLRVKDPETPRAWKIPGAIRIRRHGKTIEIPIIPVVGFTSCLTIWIIIIWLRSHAGILGGAWFLVGFIIYFLYRKKSNLPLLKSTTAPRLVSRASESVEKGTENHG